MAKGQFDQEFEFHQQLAKVKTGENICDDLSVSGQTLDGLGTWLFFAVIIFLLVALGAAMFGNFQLAALGACAVVVLVLLLYMNIKKQKQKIIEIREVQLKEHRMRKGDPRYWGRKSSQ